MIKYVEDAEWRGSDINLMMDPKRDDVYDWASEMGFKIDGGSVIINPGTFEPVRIWYFENEEVKLLFLLKWSNK